MGFVGPAHEHFAQLTGRAKQLGLQGLLAAVFRRIIDTLETDPREGGDPDTDYRGLDATGYHMVLLPAGLWIEYAVHNANLAVWISKLLVLEGSPFAGG